MDAGSNEPAAATVRFWSLVAAGAALVAGPDGRFVEDDDPRSPGTNCTSSSTSEAGHSARRTRRRRRSRIRRRRVPTPRGGAHRGPVTYLLPRPAHGPFDDPVSGWSGTPGRPAGERTIGELGELLSRSAQAPGRGRRC
ncbi:hypothetical protein [Pseudonocardia sp. TRM90224]|uniref:hypothetical protein n=1 Tax=Pseudonocardia sp. TRM90224 TaxID=2812678 RepID=UPI001E528AF8|nr:hypothetical protein [Pseudonocardia sp. TRM90224]